MHSPTQHTRAQASPKAQKSKQTHANTSRIGQTCGNRQLARAYRADTLVGSIHLLRTWDARRPKPHACQVARGRILGAL